MFKLNTKIKYKAHIKELCANMGIGASLDSLAFMFMQESLIKHLFNCLNSA